VSETPAKRHLVVVRPAPQRIRFLNTAERATAIKLSSP
jgi:hypothetical protein